MPNIRYLVSANLFRGVRNVSSYARQSVDKQPLPRSGDRSYRHRCYA